MSESLAPSERIDLIRRLRDELIERPWADIDLILSEFGASGISFIDFTERYQIENELQRQLKDLDGSSLAGLAVYVLGEESIVQAARASDDYAHLWAEGDIKVFISHLAEQLPFAETVRDELMLMGVRSFVANKSIVRDADWQVEIEMALRSCDVLVGLVHPGFNDSFWIQQEIGWALGRGVPVLMVKLGETPVGFKARKQACTPQTPNAQGASAEILVWLSHHREHGPTVTFRLVKSLREATSYSDARDAASRILGMGNLSPEILDAVGQAYLTNNQIYPRHVAVPIIEAIFRNHGRELPVP